MHTLEPISRTWTGSKAQAWDVPLEVRCAENENLTSWGPSQWIYDVYFYRALPYDPVRPWKDEDGQWYSALSTDGCNSTTRPPGGRKHPIYFELGPIYFFLMYL